MCSSKTKHFNLGRFSGTKAEVGATSAGKGAVEARTAAGKAAAAASPGGLDPSMEAALRLQEAGGLLSASAFTREAAEKAKRPLRVHRVDALIVHPNNPRPVSADDNLEDLIVDMQANGQRDPIHVVPYNGGWAIMEGQRRWLSARRCGIDTLECFEHPEMNPLDVYCYGRAIHKTRQDTSALDDALSWVKLLELEGITKSQLLERLSAIGEPISEVMLSKRLAITKCHVDLIDEVRRSPSSFSDRHLYALAQIEQVVHVQRAIEEAKRVRFAPPDAPVSANSLERLLEKLKASNGTKATRRNSSTPKAILGANGSEVGVCRVYKSGKVDFEPEAPLAPEQREELHAVVSRAIAGFFQAVNAK